MNISEKNSRRLIKLHRWFFSFFFQSRKYNFYPYELANKIDEKLRLKNPDHLDVYLLHYSLLISNENLAIAARAIKKILQANPLKGYFPLRSHQDIEAVLLDSASEFESIGSGILGSFAVPTTSLIKYVSCSYNRLFDGLTVINFTLFPADEFKELLLQEITKTQYGSFQFQGVKLSNLFRMRHWGFAFGQQRYSLSRSFYSVIEHLDQKFLKFLPKQLKSLNVIDRIPYALFLFADIRSRSAQSEPNEEIENDNSNYFLEALFDLPGNYAEDGVFLDPNTNAYLMLTEKKYFQPRSSALNLVFTNQQTIQEYQKEEQPSKSYFLDKYLFEYQRFFALLTTLFEYQKYLSKYILDSEIQLRNIRHSSRLGSLFDWRQYGRMTKIRNEAYDTNWILKKVNLNSEEIRFRLHDRPPFSNKSIYPEKMIEITYVFDRIRRRLGTLRSRFDDMEREFSHKYIEKNQILALRVGTYSAIISLVALLVSLDILTKFNLRKLLQTIMCWLRNCT